MATLAIAFADSNTGRRTLSLPNVDANLSPDIIKEAMERIAATKLFKKDDVVIYDSPLQANSVVTQTTSLYTF